MHHIFKCVGFVLFTMLSAAASAQGGALSLSTGAHHIARQDLVLSPMVQRGWAFPNVTITYSHQDSRVRQAARLGYDGYLIGNKDIYTFHELVNGKEATTAPTDYLFVDLAYEAQWTLPDSGATRVMVGGGLCGQLGSLNQGYTYPSFGYTIFFGIGPSARVEHVLDERTKLHGEFSLPVLAWVARSPYAFNDDAFIEDQRSHKTVPTLGAFIADGGWASFGSFRRAMLRLGADRQYGTRWTLGLEYGLEYVDISQPQRLISFRNSLDLTATYRFRRA